MPVTVLSFIAGALLAGAGVWYWMAHDTAQAFVLFALGDEAKAQERAMQAYQHEESSIAIWEFRHLAELQSEHLRREVDSPRNLQMELFLTHGRLAKLYHQQSRETDAQKHAEAAIAAYRHVSPTNSVITNFTTLLAWVQKFDERAKKEIRYE